jgi:hypothetical protein
MSSVQDFIYKVPSSVETFGEVHDVIMHSHGSGRLGPHIVSNIRLLESLIESELGIPLSESRQVEVSHSDLGRIRLYHATNDSTHLINALGSGNITRFPDTSNANQSIAQRCFGLGITCFTDSSLVSGYSKGKEVISFDIVADENIDVVFKVEYWAYLQKVITSLIHSSSTTLFELSALTETLIQTEKGRSLLDEMIVDQRAFTLTGALLDIICRLQFSDESRLSLRALVQERGDGSKRINFGLRTFTHSSFLKRDTLIRTVEFIGRQRIYAPLQIDALRKVVDIVMNFVLGNSALFEGNPLVTGALLDTENYKKEVEDLIVLKGFLLKDPRLIKFMKKQKGEASCSEIMQSLPLWIPEAMLFNGEHMYLGTDGGGNNVAVLTSLLEEDQISVMK